MRAKDFLNEDSGDGAGSPGSKHKGSGKLHPHHHSAIKNMNTFDELPGWYYDMYRFGVDMANGNSGNPMDRKSAGANHLNVYAYTEEEQAIIDRSSKNMGVKGTNLTGNRSVEHEGGNKTSPVAKPKRNKYGV